MHQSRFLTSHITHCSYSPMGSTLLRSFFLFLLLHSILSERTILSSLLVTENAVFGRNYTGMTPEHGELKVYHYSVTQVGPVLSQLGTLSALSRDRTRVSLMCSAIFDKLHLKHDQLMIVNSKLSYSGRCGSRSDDISSCKSVNASSLRLP